MKPIYVGKYLKAESNIPAGGIICKKGLSLMRDKANNGGHIPKEMKLYRIKITREIFLREKTLPIF